MNLVSRRVSPRVTHALRGQRETTPSYRLPLLIGVCVVGTFWLLRLGGGVGSTAPQGSASGRQNSAQAQQPLVPYEPAERGVNTHAAEQLQAENERLARELNAMRTRSVEQDAARLRSGTKLPPSATHAVVPPVAIPPHAPAQPVPPPPPPTQAQMEWNRRGGPWIGMTFSQFGECTGVTMFDQVVGKDSLDERDYVYYGGWQLIWTPGGRGGTITKRTYRSPGGAVRVETRTSQRVLTQMNKW